MTSPTTRQLASRYLDEQIGPIAPAPAIGKMLACDLRCHKTTLLKWIHQHRGDDIAAVMDAFAAAVQAIERHLP